MKKITKPIVGKNPSPREKAKRSEKKKKGPIKGIGTSCRCDCQKLQRKIGARPKVIKGIGNSN